MFNETWGLFTGKDKEKKYLPETQEWVRSVYHRAKEIDPTRLVEDNSACNYDHVETDMNTWHFYINGYGSHGDHIRKVVENTFPGSTFNFTEGNTQIGRAADEQRMRHGVGRGRLRGRQRLGVAVSLHAQRIPAA